MEETSNDLQPVISAATQESYTPMEIDPASDFIKLDEEDDKLRLKLARTKDEIINSVKKRRAQSAERLQGARL